jgi:intracellular septation protein
LGGATADDLLLTDAGGSMKQALSHLLDDYLSAALFLLAYGASGSLRAAVGVTMVVAVVPVVWLALKRRPVAPLRWVSLGLVVALGAAAWFMQNPRFVMVRPSAVHFGLAAAMARSGWMSRYLNPPAQRNVPRPVVVAAGHAWAVLMAALGFTNLIIALYFDVRVWAWFVMVTSIGVKAGALALQYVVFRSFLRRQPIEAAAGGPSSE